MNWDTYNNLQHQLLTMKTRTLQIFNGNYQLDEHGIALPNLYLPHSGTPDPAAIPQLPPLQAPQLQSLLAKATPSQTPGPSSPFTPTPLVMNAQMAEFMTAVKEQSEKEQAQRNKGTAGVTPFIASQGGSAAPHTPFSTLSSSAPSALLNMHAEDPSPAGNKKRKSPGRPGTGQSKSKGSGKRGRPRKGDQPPPLVDEGSPAAAAGKRRRTSAVGSALSNDVLPSLEDLSDEGESSAPAYSLNDSLRLNIEEDRKRKAPAVAVEATSPSTKKRGRKRKGRKSSKGNDKKEMGEREEEAEENKAIAAEEAREKVELEMLRQAVLLEQEKKARKEDVEAFRNHKYTIKPKKVVVIGAGIAGIATAKELKAKGYDVVIVEGRDRMGGRIKTLCKNMKGSKSSYISLAVEMGASFVQGVNGNPIASLCEQQGLTLCPIPDAHDCPLYDAKTGQPIPVEIDRRAELRFQQLCDVVARLKHKLSCRIRTGDTLDQLVGEVQENTSLKKVMKRVISLVPELSPTSASDEQVKELEKRLFLWHLANLEGLAGAQLGKLSYLHWDEEESNEYYGGHCLIKEGHTALLEKLAAGLEIKLNHTVESIDYSDDTKEVVVATNSGPITADLVVVTLPLGVLKKGSVKFSPPLPENKQQSIERLGFGVTNNVVLFFPTIFWDKSAHYIGNVGAEKRGECYLFLNMAKSMGYPVLVAMLSGKAALFFDTKTDTDVVDSAMGFLRKIFPSAPAPLMSLVTRWQHDPFSWGAYSYVAKGSSGADYDVLSTPLAGRLFFAGEATNRKHPGTVDGAYLSGLREAERISRLYGGA